MTDRGLQWRPTLGFSILIVVSVISLVSLSLVWNFVTDDAYISFVYARNLARSGELVFNIGERVEGYTNFLWTLMLAAFLRAGLPPEIMSRLLGTLFGILGLFTSAFASRVMRDGRRFEVWDAVPALFLATIPGYACWSSGGLETQMFTFLVTLGLSLELRRLRSEESAPSSATAVVLGVAALTRPEGVLFFASLAGAGLSLDLVRRRVRFTTSVVRTLPFLALVAPHFLWRRYYYGWWLPNTYYVKASGSGAAWSQGGYYLWRVCVDFHLWVVPALILAALAVVFLVRSGGDRKFAEIVWLLLPPISLFLLYVASVGGDFMGLYRFALPIVPILVALCTEAMRILLTGVSARLCTFVVASALIAHAAHSTVVIKRSLVIGADRGIDTPGYLKWYTLDRAAVGRWFGRQRQQDDYMVVGGAGAQVYYSDIPSLDCFGLSDAYVAHKVAATNTRPGHQKYAPLEYQLARKPTIITSNYYKCCVDPWGWKPYQPTAQEASFWGAKGYRFVSVRVPELSRPWYTFLLRADRTMDSIDAADP